MEAKPPAGPEPEFPRYTMIKMRLARQVMAGVEFIDLPGEMSEMVQNPQTIKANMDRELEPGSASRLLIRSYMSPSTQTDIFDLPQKASALADSLIGGTSRPETVDFVATMHSFKKVMDAAIDDLSETTKQRQRRRYTDLAHAFAIELAARMPIVIKEDTYTTGDVYDGVFGPRDRSDDPDFYDAARDAAQYYFMHVEDRTRLITRIIESGFPTDHEGGLNPYNKPLNAKEITALNNLAADTIERLHLLKAYDVAPLVVPADSVELPWDIAVLPPVKLEDGEETDEYDPGALADFAFLPRAERRTEAYRQVKTVEGEHKRREIDVAGGHTVIRLRLHDNGQISFGHMAHNIPGDGTEALFTMTKAYPAFVRLRGLLIAIAFDSVVPEVVVRENTGGSIARRYRELRQEAPRREPIQELLLSRVTELRSQNISRTNRRPRSWELPQHSVTGHMKRLPEGMNARPSAEEDARKHYKRLGRAFDGLPPGWNFVKGYKRGTAPENTTFRRARFRGTSATARYLGSAGLKDRPPEQN